MPTNFTGEYLAQLTCGVFSSVGLYRIIALIMGIVGLAFHASIVPDKSADWGVHGLIPLGSGWCGHGMGGRGTIGTERREIIALTSALLLQRSSPELS